MTKQVPLNEIGPGNFVGEEIFVGKGIYENTIQVFSSACRLLVFTMSMASTDFSNTFVAKAVVDAYKLKNQRRNQYMEQVMQSKPEKLLATGVQKPKERNALDDLKDQILGMTSILMKKIIMYLSHRRR